MSTELPTLPAPAGRLVDTIAFKPVRIAVLTISDTRDEESDTSGKILTDRVTAAGGELITFPAETKNPLKLWANARSLAKLVVGATGVTSMPSPAACIAVALMLVIVALWPLLYMRLLPTAWPNWLLSAIGGAFALVFLLRGAAGYTTPWRRRFSEEPFASLDRAAYSPLCMLLAASMAALLLGGAR